MKRSGQLGSATTELVNAKRPRSVAPTTQITVLLPSGQEVLRVQKPKNFYDFVRQVYDSVSLSSFYLCSTDFPIKTQREFNDCGDNVTLIASPLEGIPWVFEALDFHLKPADLSLAVKYMFDTLKCRNGFLSKKRLGELEWVMLRASECDRLLKSGFWRKKHTVIALLRLIRTETSLYKEETVPMAAFAFRKLDEHLKEDVDVFVALLRCHANMDLSPKKSVCFIKRLQYLPIHFRSHKGIVALTLTQKRPQRPADDGYEAASNGYFDDYYIGMELQYASNDIRSDKDMVLLAVMRTGVALQYASEELRADKEVVLEAVLTNGDALEFASAELRRDREVVLEAVKTSGFALEFASAELRGDREVVLEAVKVLGFALGFAAAELRGDREVVLAAVKRHGGALELASSELQGDREVLAAVKRYGVALELASSELHRAVLAAVKRHGGALELASSELQGDRAIVLAAVQRNWRALGFASSELREVVSR